MENPEKLSRRCPMLGGPVTFHYCTVTGGENGLPCGKVMDCWWEYFDVEAWLRGNLSPEEFNTLLTPKPKNKISTILDLIQQAKERIKEETD